MAVTASGSDNVGGAWYTFPATRRLIARLLDPSRPKRRAFVIAGAWWALTLLVLPLYVVLRSNADDLGMPVHGQIDRTLFGGLPTLQLQDWLWDGSKAVEWATVIVHGSWFYVPLAMGLLVTFARTSRVGSYVRWWLACEFLAVPLWALFPTQPPWMANDEVVRIIALRFGGEIQDSNALAAMPSLHVAFPLVIALWFLRERWMAPAAGMFAYGALISFEVVFSGEHYVADVLGAAAFALAIAALARIDYAALVRPGVVRLKPIVAALRPRRGRRFSPATRRRLIHTFFWSAGAMTMLVAFSFIRRFADDVGMPVHGSAIETSIFSGLPTVWLQDTLYGLWPAGFSLALVAIHLSWFLSGIAAIAIVAIFRHERLGSLVAWWFGLNVIAHLSFIVFPLEPPWLASGEVARVLETRLGPIEDTNPLAAMPSLHVAVPLLFGFWFLRERWLLPAYGFFAYSGLVAFEVVMSGEHYVIDIGGAVAACGTVALVAPRMRPAFDSVRRAVGSWRPSLAPRRLEPARQTASDRGQVLIEFALLLPIIFVLALTIFDFGMAIDHRQVVQHAVREGARAGAVGASEAQIIDEVVSESGELIEAANVTVCYVDGDDPGSSPGNAGDSVRVSATYTYEFTVGSGELLSVFGIDPGGLSIEMTPSGEAILETSILGASACP